MLRERCLPPPPPCHTPTPSYPLQPLLPPTPASPSYLPQVLGYFGVGFSGRYKGEFRGNMRVPRQVLRRLLFERLAPGTVHWGWKLRHYDETPHTSAIGYVEAELERVLPPVGEAAASEASPPRAAATRVRARVLVGADGVRSAVRAQKHGDALRYVGVAIVLGVSDYQHPLLHGQGFYTVDGTHRMFTMPFEPLAGASEATSDASVAVAEVAPPGAAPPGTAPPGTTTPPHSTMWQLSFALEDESQARALCAQPPAELLAEIERRCVGWHTPVQAMLSATRPGSVWGTPLLDRALLPRRRRGDGSASALARYCSRVTLMGDAAHPMTPFKGQGANQALADAPLLAEKLRVAVAPRSAADEGVRPHEGVRPQVRVLANALASYEREMCDRAEAKVVASREAALAYHSAAAQEPAAYGFVGIPDIKHVPLLAALRRRGVTAHVGNQGAAELIRQAVQALDEVEVSPG